MASNSCSQTSVVMFNAFEKTKTNLKLDKHVNKGSLFLKTHKFPGRQFKEISSDHFKSGMQIFPNDSVVFKEVIFLITYRYFLLISTST